MYTGNTIVYTLYVVPLTGLSLCIQGKRIITYCLLIKMVRWKFPQVFMQDYNHLILNKHHLGSKAIFFVTLSNSSNSSFHKLLLFNFSLISG